MRPEAIAAVLRHHEDQLTPDERDLATYIRLVARGQVSNEWYEKMEVRFGRRGCIEFTAFIAYLMLVIRLQQAFGVPEPSHDEIDALVDGYLAGTAPVPDPAIASRIW